MGLSLDVRRCSYTDGIIVGESHGILEDMRIRSTAVFALLIALVPFCGYAQEESPNTVDIIIEADTYVPAFYKGRAEPTPGSTVRAIALPNGSLGAASYTYRWELNGQYLGDGSSVSFTVPYGREFLLRVDVFSSSGTRIGTGEEYVPISEPIIHFYQTNILRGMSFTTVPINHIMVEEEMSVRAEPYFVTTPFSSRDYVLSWSVNALKKVGSGQFTISF